MAQAELAVQTNIIKSVRRDGGYGRKMSNRFAIGVPDLLVALPQFAPCVIEVKDFGKVADTFDRQIETTDKQREEMKLFSQPYEDGGLGRTAFVAVRVVHRGEDRLVVLPRLAERLSSAYEDDPQTWRKRQVGLYYEIPPMLRRWKAATCRLPHHL